VTLDALYQERCRRPCEYVGFSFTDTPEEMRAMVEHGANAVGSGFYWVPTEDATAPYGAGVPNLGQLADPVSLGQSFHVEAGIDAVALVTPTFFTKGSGCTLTLYRGRPDAGSGLKMIEVAREVFADVGDNQHLWLSCPGLAAGEVYLEQSAPTGPAIGVWAADRDTLASGRAYVNRVPYPGDDLELWCRSAAGEVALVPQIEGHHDLRLGLGLIGQVDGAGLAVAYLVGNWNNGGFSCYPEWFNRKYPDMAMLDQDRQPVPAGMLGKLEPWPSLDHPAIADGTDRHIRAVIGALRERSALLYWVMGGEALYATYLMPGRWTDYSADAVAHYRAWLRRTYGTVAALQAEWGPAVTDFAGVVPPAAPGRDLPSLTWFRYRNQAMAERLQLHFAAAKAADPSRLVLSCNHGTIFQGLAGTWLGQDLALFAGVSDGWEMGQIVVDADPDLFNLQWMRAAGTFGKPLCPDRLAYRHSNPRARGGGTSYTPAAAHRYFWESVGTGAWHMGFLQWSGEMPDGEWGVKGTPAQAEIRTILTQWHGVETYFDDAWPVMPRVGLFLSQPTWTLDGFRASWTRLHTEFTRAQVDYRVLLDRQLLAGDTAGLTTIVAADNRVISGDCLAVLQGFRDRGGELLLIGDNGNEDEGLRPRQPAPFAAGLPSADAVVAALAGRADFATRLVRVTCTSAERYTEPYGETTTGQHDTPHDLASAGPATQTFTATRPGLVSVAACNPTYSQTLTAGELTIELRAGGADGKVLASRGFASGELTDNAWHEIRLPQPAPAGTYALRLVASPGLAPQHLGVWGTAEDCYPGGSLILGDRPASGDLELRLGYETEFVTKSRAIEAFPLSDGTNLLVVLLNTAPVEMRAELSVAPDLLPAAGSYAVRELLTGTDLEAALAPTADAIIHLPVPAQRSRVVYYAAPAPADVGARVQAAEARLAGLPRETTTAQRAHLARARDALAGSRPEKAWACLRRAAARAPLSVRAEVVAGGLRIRALSPGAGEATAGALTAAFVPLPEAAAVEFRADGPGAWVADVPAASLGTRYDYARREYVPWWGAVEVVVSGEVGGRTAAAACVVEVPRR
jgi:hypothetical protein